MQKRSGDYFHGPALALGLLLLSACATSQPQPTALESQQTAMNGTHYTQPIFNSERVVLDDVDTPLAVRDPWQGLNRRIYRFNAAVDDLVLNPSVAAYRLVTPAFARQGITNFFDNLDDLRTFINQGLQVRPVRAGQTALRILTNSTLGVVGLFDVATRFGIPRYDEDFGQTLGRYGIGPGPYVMLPLFGPSTLRDAFGRAVDAGVSSVIDPLDLNDHPSRNLAYYPLLVIDTRATTAFQYFETGSPFEYGLVRKLFVTKRALDVKK